MEELLNLLAFAVFIGVAYIIGKNIETKHYQQITQQEKEFLNLPSMTTRKYYDEDKIIDAQLVMGNVVISGDYFKLILAGLLKLFGGRLIGYESLIDRGRREAILRMKAEAKKLGATAVINMRFETSKLDGMINNNSTGMFEILAYGTAIKLK